MVDPIYMSSLDHRCDIYHLARTDVSPGWGLAPSPSFDYPDTPDIRDLPCHFNVQVKSRQIIIQQDPQKDYEADIKLQLPPDVDIRVNDKVVDKATGYIYTAGINRNIRGHHMIAYLKREKVAGKALGDTP